LIDSQRITYNEYDDQDRVISQNVEDYNQDGELISSQLIEYSYDEYGRIKTQIITDYLIVFGVRP